MKRLLSAIARALKSSVSFVWDRCARTGAWTLRAVASLTGGGDSAPADTPVQDLERAMVDDLITQKIDTGVPPAIGGDGYDRLQRVCRDINTGDQPKGEDWAALSPLQKEWIALLDGRMRLVVGNVEKDALVQHMKGGKGLKGVVRCDVESIAGWKHSMEIERLKAEIGEPEPADEAKLAI